MAPPTRRPIREALLYPLLAALLLLVEAGYERTGVSGAALAMNAVTLLLALVVSIVAHEAAHALVAHAVGLRVLALVVGGGPSAWQIRFGVARVMLHAVPFTGITLIASPTRAWLRARLAAVYAAGPLLNVVLFGLSMAFVRPGAATRLAVLPEPLACFAIVNGVLAVLNALPVPPRRRRGGSRLGASDGWNVLAMPFYGEAWFEPLLSAFVASEAARLLEQGNVADALVVVEQAFASSKRPALVVRIAHTNVLIWSARWSEARERLAELLGEGEVRELRGVLANNLAWADFMLDDPALLDEADSASKEALERLPDAPFAKGTRGAVLVARGQQLDAAESLLLAAMAKNEAPNQALNACCLAMFHARRVDVASADLWLRRARELDGGCPLLPRAERLVGDVVREVPDSPVAG